MNYIVICPGHIAQFAQYEAARGFAADFGGQVFNLAGLLEARAMVERWRSGKGKAVSAAWAKL